MQGRRAVGCCERGRAQLENHIRTPLADATAILLEGLDKRTGLALVPPGVLVPGVIVKPSQLPRIIRVLPGTLGLGLIAFLPSAYLVSVAQTTTALETLTSVFRMLDLASRTSKDQESCEDCVRKNAWKQTKYLGKEKVPGRTRDSSNQLPARPVGRPRKTSPTRTPSAVG